MKYILGIILLVFSQFVNASDNAIVINLASNHIGAKNEYNEQNFGLGYKFDTHEIGFYRNSYYKTEYNKGSGYSLYLRETIWNHQFNPLFTARFDAGIAYYGNDGGYPILIFGSLNSDINITKHDSLNIGYVPLFRTNGNEQLKGILTFSFTHKF